MVDLVTDCRTAIKDLTSESNVGNKGTVQFKFSHVLTQIANVKVKPDVNLGAETRIFVTGLKLSPEVEYFTTKRFMISVLMLGMPSHLPHPIFRLSKTLVSL